MRNFIASIALVAALAGGSSALAAPSKPTRQCFWPNDVTSFAAVNDHVVNVRVGVRDVYQLTLSFSSPDIDWTQRLGVQSTAGSTICSGLDATLIVPSTIGLQRYPVTAVRKLTVEEIAALPAKQKP